VHMAAFPFRLIIKGSVRITVMPSLRSFTLNQRCILALVSALVANPVAAPAQYNGATVRDAGAVNRLGQEFVSSDRSDALSIAIIRAGNVAFFDFGTTQHGKEIRPTKESVYEIGSITKLFTSLLLAHAVLDGKLGLQDDIRRYLPGDYANLSFEGSPVRMIDLADTTSALPDNLPNFQEVTAQAQEREKAFVLANVLNIYSQQDMLRDLHSVALIGRPGADPRHSNLAAELLGYILTRVYGQSFTSLLQAKIQKPLSMENGVSPDNSARMVQGYDPQHVAMPETNQSAVLTAGGLRYSAEDMAKFLQAELTSRDEAILLTQRPVVGRPETGAVGFNWQISRNVEGALKLNASGGTSGGASYVEIYPERGYGVVLLANRSGETEGHLYELADTLFAAVEGTPGLDALKADLTSTRYHDVKGSLQRSKLRFPQLTLSESYVNNWAGGLLGSDPKAALALFEYNVGRWPDSSDAFDSLGEGYEQNGNPTGAIEAYRKALQLNPANKEASASLASLQARQNAR